MSEPDVTVRYPRYTAELVIQGPQGPPGVSGGTAVAPYVYRGGSSAIDPGPGGLTIQVTTGQNRVIAVSKTDADGAVHRPQMLLTGDAVTVADAPGGSATGFARYLLTADPVDRGGWVTMAAVRTDVVGTPAPPPLGTRVSVYGSFSGAGELYAPRDEVWGPGITGPAPIITAHDPATGRLAIGGQELGDTGWRDMRGELANGWASWTSDPKCVLRRCGDTVQFIWYANGTAATDNFAITIPVGFRPVMRTVCLASGAGSSTVHYAYDLTEFSGRLNSTDRGGLAFVSFTYLTSQAWPAVVPGAPFVVIDDPEPR